MLRKQTLELYVVVLGVSIFKLVLVKASSSLPSFSPVTRMHKEQLFGLRSLCILYILMKNMNDSSADCIQAKAMRCFCQQVCVDFVNVPLVWLSHPILFSRELQHFRSLLLPSRCTSASPSCPRNEHTRPPLTTNPPSALALQ